MGGASASTADDPAIAKPRPSGAATTAEGSRRVGRPRRGGGVRAAFRRAASRSWLRQLAVLALFEAAGIAATWPRATFLVDGTLPATTDVASYVWGFWWVAHQLTHLGNPFTTAYMSAPVGTPLGFSTLMPLVGWVMAPVTIAYGPSASLTLVAIVTPGLLCYAMYRAARLWLNAPGALTAGAFFGLSSMVLWQNWYHINIALGTIFLPVTIEAAVRFRRKAGWRPAVALGLALGASVLVNQESALLALGLAIMILLPWLVAKLFRDTASLPRLGTRLALGAVIALAVASPELIAMAQQVAAGSATVPPGALALNYTQYGVPLPTLFAPSPRLAYFGLGGLASAYSFNDLTQLREAVPTFGATLTGLALLGLVAGWRRRSTWCFGALWLCGAVLALGTSVTIGSRCHFNQLVPGNEWGRSCRQYTPLLTHMHWTRVTPPHGKPYWAEVQMSNLMPYTWLVRIGWLSGLREADRFAIAGLVGAALLAGRTVQWLCRRRATIPLIAIVVALGALESGWSGVGGATMPTVMPSVDQPLTQDHSSSIVVDVPFGERGGVSEIGSDIAPASLLIATHDGHRRAISYTSWVANPMKLQIEAHPFYWNLISVEGGGTPSHGQLRRARTDLRKLHVGWVVEWRGTWVRHHPGERFAHVNSYLRKVGFRFVRVACMVRAKDFGTCPRKPVNDQVWLYQYHQYRSRRGGRHGLQMRATAAASMPGPRRHRRHPGQGTWPVRPPPGRGQARTGRGHARTGRG